MYSGLFVLINVIVVHGIGTEEKVRACKDYGADVAINYKNSDFVTEVVKVTNGKGTGNFLAACDPFMNSQMR